MTVRTHYALRWVGIIELYACVALGWQDVFGYTSSSLAVADMADDERERNAGKQAPCPLPIDCTPPSQ